MSDHWRDQPRVPAGNPDGGQWTSSTSKRALDNILDKFDDAAIERTLRNIDDIVHDYDKPALDYLQQRLDERKAERVEAAANAAREAAGLALPQKVYFSDEANYASARYGTDILYRRAFFESKDDAGRRDVLAHELAHNIVDRAILANPAEWERAAQALLLDKPDNYREFILGQMRIAEAIAETIAAYVLGHPDPMLEWPASAGEPPWDAAKWEQAMQWAESALAYVGITKDEFLREVERLLEQLKEQL